MDQPYTIKTEVQNNGEILLFYVDGKFFYLIKQKLEQKFI